MNKILELQERRRELRIQVARFNRDIREIDIDIERELRVGFKKTGLLPSMPKTAGDWELCSSVKGAEDAAKRLTKELEKTLLWFTEDAKKGDVRKTAERCAESMRGALAKESEFGATDTEPRYHLHQAIIDHGRALGYEMDPDWLW